MKNTLSTLYLREVFRFSNNFFYLHPNKTQSSMYYLTQTKCLKKSLGTLFFTFCKKSVHLRKKRAILFLIKLFIFDRSCLATKSLYSCFAHTAVWVTLFMFFDKNMHLSKKRATLFIIKFFMIIKIIYKKV